MPTRRPHWIILQQSSRGRISRNLRSRILQLEFGNIMLRFDVEGFRRFMEFLTEIESSDFHRSNCICGMRGRIAIELHPNGVVMTLDRKEASELRETLAGAWSVLRLASREFWRPHSGN